MREMKQDIIRISGLEVFANHGVFPEENVLGQKFVVNAVLYTDTRKAGRTDDLSASIHYGEVCAFIDGFLKKHTFALIERAAECLAEELLLKTKGLDRVRLEIAKPWAPVKYPLKTVSVEIERGWHTVYLALGSNIGDREKHLRGAVSALDSIRGCSVEKVSGFLETAPYGVLDQPDFLNGCLEIRTLLYPGELLEELHRIEAEAGRQRTLRWGPRTLDLDIIFYDDLVLQEKKLCIPHAEMHKREFVLRPLAEIAPYVRHPVYGLTVKEMLEKTEQSVL